MKYIKKKIFLVAGFACIIAFYSCSDKDLAEVTTTAQEGEEAFIYAEIVTRAPEDDETEPGDGDTDGVYDIYHSDQQDRNEATILFDDTFKNGDALYFTQLVSGILVPFQKKMATDYPASLPPSFVGRYPDEYSNLYTYYCVTEYDENGELNKEWYPTEWKGQEEGGMGGYNFFPQDLAHKMEWEDIEAWGYDNNGYALFALYFPYDNQLSLDFQVPADQTDISALRKSNFIGAYHSSSSSGRLRFRLYHLMCYFKLTLYIPVFKDDDVDDKGNRIRTGYPADALQEVQLLDVLTKFNINWYANRSSDDAPACAAIAGEQRNDIQMFIPPLTPEFYENSLPPVVTINTSYFFNDDYDPNAIDECWKITVSALIPAGQNFDRNDSQYPGLIWSNKNFIRINMRQNIGEVPKTFVFNGNPDEVQGGHLVSGSDLSLEQGGIQHLSLYIPRHGAAAVLVGANVVDWQQAYNNQWGLSMEDPIDNGNSGEGGENGGEED